MILSTKVMRKSACGLVVGAMIATASVLLACYLPSNWRCGACTGCTYAAVCSVYPPRIELCTGDSPGELVPTVVSAGFGYWGAVPALGLCGAPVVLTGSCCGGARTTTTDWTPVVQWYPVVSGCPF